MLMLQKVIVHKLSRQIQEIGGGGGGQKREGGLQPHNQWEVEKNGGEPC